MFPVPLIDDDLLLHGMDQRHGQDVEQSHGYRRLGLMHEVCHHGSRDGAIPFGLTVRRFSHDEEGGDRLQHPGVLLIE
jgi:hypothetical protein